MYMYMILPNLNPHTTNKSVTCVGNRPTNKSIVCNILIIIKSIG